MSLIAGQPSYAYGPVAPGVYDAYFYATTEDLHVAIASTDHQNLSFYFMVDDEGLRALEEKSLDNVTVLLKQENINSYNGVLSIPQQGGYAILIAPANTNVSSVGYNMTVQRLVPYLSVLATGALMIIFALALKWRIAFRRFLQ
ncbi:MAG: hypothetical protein ACYTFW_11545 [Planctomycetota bacterium]